MYDNLISVKPFAAILMSKARTDASEAQVQHLADERRIKQFTEALDRLEG